MTVRVSGLFESTDAAEGAIRGLSGIPIYKRRISRISSRSLGSETDTLGQTPAPIVPVFAIGNIGQGLGQGIFLPASLYGVRQPVKTNNDEVQLEVWVAPLDAQGTIERFINAHGHQVRLC